MLFRPETFPTSELMSFEESRTNQPILFKLTLA
jgi:hypothetical protein